MYFLNFPHICKNTLSVLTEFEVYRNYTRIMSQKLRLNREFALTSISGTSLLNINSDAIFLSLSYVMYMYYRFALLCNRFTQQRIIGASRILRSGHVRQIRQVTETIRFEFTCYRER